MSPGIESQSWRDVPIAATSVAIANYCCCVGHDGDAGVDDVDEDGGCGLLSCYQSG